MPPVNQNNFITFKSIRNIQYVFLAFFILLQIGFYYIKPLLIIVGFTGGFIFGIYWMILLHKKKKADKIKLEKLIEQEKNETT